MSMGHRLYFLITNCIFSLKFLFVLAASVNTDGMPHSG